MKKVVKRLKAKYRSSCALIFFSRQFCTLLTSNEIAIILSLYLQFTTIYDPWNMLFAAWIQESWNTEEAEGLSLLFPQADSV